MSNKPKTPDAPPKRERVTFTPRDGGTVVIEPEKRPESHEVEINAKAG